MAGTSKLFNPLVQRAVRLLEEMLVPAAQDGLPAQEVIEAGERIGVTRNHLRSAREILGVVSYKGNNCWVWVIGPDHKPFEFPSAEPRYKYKPQPPQRVKKIRHPSRPITETEGPASLEDEIRAWASKKWVVPQTGPLPQWAVAAWERERAKPAVSHRQVRYQARCPECDALTVWLTKTVLFRETPDGELVGVDDPEGTRYIVCDSCKGQKLSGKHADIEKRIASLEHQIRVVASADKNDPNIISMEQSIHALRRELRDYERSLTQNAY
jgi:hypothetical protein